MTAVEELARAKVNLTLHVTGQRADGYHLLDSLVVFADVGDIVTAEPADRLTLRVTGPRAAGVPTDGTNLVLRAADFVGSTGAALTLDKRLPAASGIGGGSADAMATLRALARISDGALPDPGDVVALGADAPVCLHNRACRMQGIGERLAPVPPLPPMPAVLVNPGVELSTPAVFAAMTNRSNAPMSAIPETVDTPGTLIQWLARQRNDLEAPAMALAPEIAVVRDRLRAEAGCLLARMSGSGATCFGVFASETEAINAAAAIARSYPDWWVAPTTLA